MKRPDPLAHLSPIDRLPEPARSLAVMVVDQLEARGHAREDVAEQAAKQAASYVAERGWSTGDVPREIVDRVEASAS